MTFNEITMTLDPSVEPSESLDIVEILTVIIACLGIISNLIVVTVFLNHKKFRYKIPNLFIIHQVTVFNFYWLNF